MAIRKGSKYFKFDNGVPKVIRVSRQKGNEYSVKLENGKFEKLTKEDIERDYILLSPSGVITFTIVAMPNNGKDVIVSLHRRSDITENPNALPYAVCRQNVTDIFTNPTTKQYVRGTLQYIGVSISQDTCPADVDYTVLTGCESIISMEMISIYRDDTLQNIVSLINKKKYNTPLLEMYNKVTDPFVRGHCSDISELLRQNNFMYDFYSAFNINIIPIVVDHEAITLDLNTKHELIAIVEQIVCQHISDIFVVPYTNDIDFTMIKRSFVNVIDAANKQYVVTYDIDENYSGDSYVRRTKEEIKTAMGKR